MKSSLTTSTARLTETANHQSPVLKVCLHRVDAARSDVRACRAAATLRDASLSVTLIDIDRDQTSLVDLPPGIRVQHMRSRGVSDSPRFKPWLLVTMFRFFIARVWLLLRSQADVYHALEVRAVLACVVAGMLRRKPVIYEVYDVPFDGPYFQSTAIRRMYRALSLRMLRLIGPSLAGLIVTSDGHGREMSRLLNRKPDVIVRNIPEYEPPSARDEIRQYLGLDNTVRIALYQGYFQWNRALDALVGAARYLEPGIVIVLRGDGPTRREIEQLIGALGVQDRVRFAPFAHHDDQMAWTSSATIGLSIYRPNLSPNVQGILPNKVFEYLMAGVPVLNTLPEVATLLETYEVGRTIDTIDSQSLAHAISAMVSDRDGLERMRNNALKACERELRWEVERLRLLRLYEAILGTPLTGDNPMIGP